MPFDGLIRQASVNDLEIITQFTLQLHNHEDDGELATHKDFEARLKKWLRSELDDQKNLILLAETASNTLPNQTIGFIAATSVINDNGFLLAPSKGVIQLLWVDRPYRKQGVADKLVSNVENCFKNIGIKYVECTFTSQNNLAESYWKRNGYNKSSFTARKFI